MGRALAVEGVKILGGVGQDPLPAAFGKRTHLSSAIVSTDSRNGFWAAAWIKRRWSSYENERAGKARA